MGKAPPHYHALKAIMKRNPADQGNLHLELRVQEEHKRHVLRIVRAWDQQLTPKSHLVSLAAPEYLCTTEIQLVQPTQTPFTYQTHAYTFGLEPSSLVQTISKLVETIGALEGSSPLRLALLDAYGDLVHKPSEDAIRRAQLLLGREHCKPKELRRMLIAKAKQLMDSPGNDVVLRGVRYFSRFYDRGQRLFPLLKYYATLNAVHSGETAAWFIETMHTYHPGILIHPSIGKPSPSALFIDALRFFVSYHGPVAGAA